MHSERRALFSTAPAATRTPAGIRRRRFGCDHFTGDKIAYSSEVPRQSDPHVRFGVAIVLRDESLVVVRKESHLAGTIQAHGKSAHDIVFDRSCDAGWQPIEVVEV